MADKQATPQPQSGASGEQKKDFRQEPRSDNKSETGQDTGGLAPLLHWDVKKDKPKQISD